MTHAFPDARLPSELWVEACEHLSQYAQPFKDGTVAGFSQDFGLTPRMDLIAHALVYAVGTPAYNALGQQTMHIPRKDLPTE